VCELGWRPTLQWAWSELPMLWEEDVCDGTWGAEVRWQGRSGAGLGDGEMEVGRAGDQARSLAESQQFGLLLSSNGLDDNLHKV